MLLRRLGVFLRNWHDLEAPFAQVAGFNCSSFRSLDLAHLSFEHRKIRGFPVGRTPWPRWPQARGSLSSTPQNPWQTCNAQKVLRLSEEAVLPSQNLSYTGTTFAIHVCTHGMISSPFCAGGLFPWCKLSVVGSGSPFCGFGQARTVTPAKQFPWSWTPWPRCLQASLGKYPFSEPFADVQCSKIGFASF